jgi:hypothetical protein
LKASHGWSDDSFSELLSLLAKLLPKPNTLPTSTYRVKKLICPLSLGVDKIHTCPNHFILYRKEHEFKTKCPVRGVSRYKRSYNHVYVDTMKKRNKKNTAIGPESVDDENDSDEEDNKKRKIPALAMWYLPDEDTTPMDTNNTPQADIEGPITRARARHLNLQVISFLRNYSCAFESSMLPNYLIVLRNEGED